MNSRQHDFRITRISQQSNLLQDLSRRDTAAQASSGWNNAVGAAVVATFLNLEERPGMSRQSPRSQHRNTAFSLDVTNTDPRRIEICCFDQAQQVVEPVEPDDEVDTMNSRHLF